MKGNIHTYIHAVLDHEVLSQLKNAQQIPD